MVSELETCVAEAMYYGGCSNLRWDCFSKCAWVGARFEVVRLQKWRVGDGLKAVISSVMNSDFSSIFYNYYYSYDCNIDDRLRAGILEFRMKIVEVIASVAKFKKRKKKLEPDALIS